MPDPVSFTLNHKPVEARTDPQRMLLWVLRADFGLTGTKYGCGEGHCGACTVLLDGVAVRSCLTPLAKARGKEVLTIEGLATSGKLHAVQQAFVDHDALQCGFCTPGMILTGVAFLKRNAQPSRDQIARGLEQNLCRCGAHTRILDAMEAAAKTKVGS